MNITHDMKTIETFDDLIDAWGGHGTFAKWCGVVPSAISNWKQFGGPPPSYHLRLYLECRNRRLRVTPSVFGLPPDWGLDRDKRENAAA